MFVGRSCSPVRTSTTMQSIEIRTVPRENRTTAAYVCGVCRFERGRIDNERRFGRRERRIEIDKTTTRRKNARNAKLNVHSKTVLRVTYSRRTANYRNGQRVVRNVLSTTKTKEEKIYTKNYFAHANELVYDDNKTIYTRVDHETTRTTIHIVVEHDHQISWSCSRMTSVVRAPFGYVLLTFWNSKKERKNPPSIFELIVLKNIQSFRDFHFEWNDSSFFRDGSLSTDRLRKTNGVSEPVKTHFRYEA